MENVKPETLDALRALKRAAERAQVAYRHAALSFQVAIDAARMESGAGPMDVLDLMDGTWREQPQGSLRRPVPVPVAAP